MDVIFERDIDFSKLNKLRCSSNSESILYHDGETLYKMFKNIPITNLENKRCKIELLGDGDKIDNVVMPNDIVVKNSYLSGYTMDYVYKGIPLFFYVVKDKSINNFFRIVRDCSLTLRNIHSDPRDIVVGDLSFTNILFDEKGKHYFIDFDSCKIGDYTWDMMSFLFDDYTKQRRIYRFSMDKSTDRLNMMICVLYTIFRKYIDQVSMYEYDSMAEKNMVLTNMREYVVEMKKMEKLLIDVPYMDELVPKPVKIRVKCNK